MSEQWYETLDEAIAGWRKRRSSGGAAVDILMPFALESVEQADRILQLLQQSVGPGYHSYLFRTARARAESSPTPRVKPEPPAPKPERPKRVRKKGEPAVPYRLVPQHLQRRDRWVVVRFPASVAGEFDGRGIAVITGADWTSFVEGLLDVEWPVQLNLNNLLWEDFTGLDHYLGHFRVMECSRPEADRLKEFMGGSETGLIAWIEE